MNKYLEIQNEFKSEIIKLIKKIMMQHNYELELKIEDLNLLLRDNNCISSSTSIGFLLEEFVTSKLLTLCENHSTITIKREYNKSTQNSSYDFYCLFKEHLFLINLKVDKGGNNAIAAINQLHSDYNENNNNITKHFMIIKLIYSIQDAKIKVNDIDSYFLEEVDFSKGYHADSRNWSESFNNNSGRLQVSKKFLENNRTPNELISNIRTKDQIDKIYNNIIKKFKKIK